ncbi:neurotrypsin-like isoform X2 [Daktulosphaira vitifoliae]|uniref:neurotrypsin-like isoform X2 n=1 Tax=Daktulosphaira vitifoliae TaxID=58002 RepID=UPI0021AA8BBC|nr:neurotrypsin-like isoform X2 [Daktulosphaira vitifoliae]
MTEKIWKVQFCFLVILFYIDAFKLEKIKIKNDKHWKVNVIKNHLKKHKSLEGIVRLVNSNNENEGNIEILHSGLWGTICDDEWDILDGQVVCRQLGFKQIRKITHNSFFGQASRKYWIDNIRCTGQESELTDCQFSNWGENDCDSSEAAGVICEKNYLDQNNTMTPMFETKLKKLKIKETYGSNLKLRLSGGSTNNEGRIEIKINGDRC